ncbi:MAG: pyruvate, phosphate dikinase [Planctomycetes bacterium]|nr:pyruvate, phosphate dikinase [Planctomycetota bacterium]NOG54219.1 pyruvate, phosphate dikinase [Planctomycetota bacterium]
MVYLFGRSRTDGSAALKHLLGGKGANLAEMTSIGLPVPTGFTITTEACHAYITCNNTMPAGLMDQVREGIDFLQQETSKRFGDDSNPLLVSVRSGAAVSMPGMMDTILNLGLNDISVKGLANATGNPRFAYDAYRRLINMFGDVVMGVDHSHFEAAFDEVKQKYEAVMDTEVPEKGIIELCDAYKAVYKAATGDSFPQDPYAQLEAAIEAVFSSWNKHTAITFRQKEGITGLLGTGVNVQTMVFGNMGDDSGTGVAFTRNPSTGENDFFGEFLVNAQGEDVVAGIRTPLPVSDMSKWQPELYQQLLEIRSKLEVHYKDMQDLEFTTERGTLYILQTRNGKRTGAAAVRMACEMVSEGLITQDEALCRVPANDLTQLLLPSFDLEAKKKADPIAKGLPASPGAAVGRLAFTAEETVQRTTAGESVILVRKETSPEDVAGMHSAAGILTSTGGMTSHAAVVARGWGKCCVAGASDVQIDAKNQTATIKGQVFGPNDTLSIDGNTGEVYPGELARVSPSLSGDLETLMAWADETRSLGIRTNADNPEDASRARGFGAEGIGLCRTEHMFFDKDRIGWIRKMIMAESVEQREECLSKLLPFQREDFVGIFTAMAGLPVTIRLLDPPLHEFLPQDDKAQNELAEQFGLDVAFIKRRVADLHEANPMLGHRGCRLAVTYPEVLVMQVTAIVEAAIECRRNNIVAMPEIMVPLIGTAAELSKLRALIEKTINEVKQTQQFDDVLGIPIGTMIEIPRAAITADEVARHADFFSFGTNDLTQMTFGFSRDDINSFLPDYLDHELLPCDPFQTLDRVGVGPLVKMACEKGREVKDKIKLGICGEHGGDPNSVEFCHEVGLDYVSCSPFRVPIARLAAAQAAVNAKNA